MTDKESKFHKLLEDFDNAMLITVAADGQMHARPMAIAEIESDENIWFVTSAESGKLDEIKGDARVCVACQSGNRFLSLSGTATVSRDQGKINEVWNEAWRVWFPEGNASPEIRLIRVTSTQGEYWDRSRLQGVKYLYEAGKGYASGQTPTIDEEMHAKVDLH